MRKTRSWCFERSFRIATLALACMVTLGGCGSNSSSLTQAELDPNVADRQKAMENFMKTNGKPGKIKANVDPRQKAMMGFMKKQMKGSK